VQHFIFSTLPPIAKETNGALRSPHFDLKAEHEELAGDELPPAEYAAAMSRATGATVHYAHVPRETFAVLGFPGAEDLADMFEYYRLHIPSRAKDVEACRAVAPDLQSFETWMARHGSTLRAGLGTA
jgi:hypothetical protein